MEMVVHQNEPVRNEVVICEAVMELREKGHVIRCIVEHDHAVVSALHQMNADAGDELSTNSGHARS